MNPQTKETFSRFVQKRGRKEFTIQDYCFDKQIEFIKDPHRFKTACCGGRAGKTVADAAYLTQSAGNPEGGVSLYLTLSRTNAKKLVWPELKIIQRKYKLGWKVNEADLSIQNGDSFIYLSGASTRDEIEKFRGLPFRLVLIDEVQSFPSFIRELVDDVIIVRLFDYSGTLAFTGTPGPVPYGYFFDACHNKAYRHFHWTMFDNPWISKKSGKSPEELLEQELKRKGVTKDNPSIQREIFGKWVHDSSNLVLCYSEEKNHFKQEPIGPWHHIMGIDLGFQDADAIAILGYTDKSPQTFLREELITAKQGLTELVTQIELLKQRYDPHKIVMDFGGLGNKIAEEMIRRHQIPVVAAEKARKFENIELMNDALRTQRLMAKSGSRFAHDSKLLEWDTDKMRPDRKVISDRFHSDIIDAVLYAFRESPAYTYEEPAVLPKEGTAEWGKREEELMFQHELERLEQQEVDVGLEFL